MNPLHLLVTKVLSKKAHHFYNNGIGSLRSKLRSDRGQEVHRCNLTMEMGKIWFQKIQTNYPKGAIKMVLL